MGTIIYRGFDFDSGDTIELEHAPNPWTSYHLTINGYLRMSYDSLIVATADLMQAAANIGINPNLVLNDVVSHFNDDKIYAGEDDGTPFLINEYEWDEED